MSEIDKVIERLAQNAANELLHDGLLDDSDEIRDAMATIVETFEPLRRVLKAARAVIAPASFHSHDDFAKEGAELTCPKCLAEDELRKALADLQEVSK